MSGYYPNGEPAFVKISVRNRNGIPIEGLDVLVNDTSATSRGITNSKGIASFKIAENVISDVWVDGKCFFRSNFLCQINASSGLDFNIVLSGD